MCSHPIPFIDYGFKTNKDGKTVRNLKMLDTKHKYFGYGIEELKERFGSSLILMPCGHCYSCSVNYSRSWSNRIMLEAQQYGDNNCFLTLTYSDNFLPDKLTKKPLQLFIRRLRKAVGKVRFFACGELGEGKGVREKGNPHYHVIIFGYSFPDKVVFQKSSSGNFIYRSKLLEELWPYGMSSIGTVSPDSALYVAKYSLKRKTTGNDSGEFVLMSRRPGIGAGSYSRDIWDTDRIYLAGMSFKPPRYFEKLAEKNVHGEYLLCKFQREDRMSERALKKYTYGLDREDQAFVRDNEIRIMKDCYKRRFI